MQLQFRCSTRAQFSVLDCFLMYTTWLSTIISSITFFRSSPYVDDTPLLQFSYHPSNFRSIITSKMLYNRCLAWMTANLLTLNFSTTELLIRLKQELSKIHISLSITHCTCNLGFIFDEHHTFSEQISALATFANFAASVHILASKQPAPLPTALSILNLTTVILCITTFQTINSVDSNRFTTLLIAPLFRHKNSHISLPF